MRGAFLLAVLVGLGGCVSGNLDEALDLTSGVADEVAGFHADVVRDAFSVLRLESRRPYTGFERRGPEKEELPLHLRVDDAVTLSLAGGLSDADLAARIEASTGLGLTFVGQRPAEAAGSGDLAWDASLLPEGGIWTGPLDGLLDAWCSALGYEWVYEAGGIEIVRNRSVVFRLNALAGAQNVQGSTSTSEAGGGGGSSNLARQALVTETAYNPWPEIEAQLKAQLDPSSQVAASPAAAAVVVTGLPSDIDRARSYFAWLNRTVLRPVTLTVDIYQVRFRDQSDFDIGVEGTLKRLFDGNVGLDLGSDFAGIVRPAPGTDSLAATIGALHQAGSVARVLSATVPSLNAQPAQFFELFSESYLTEIRTTIVDGTRSTNLVPGTVSSGFAMTFVAQIVSPGEILVRLFASLQDRPAFTVFESANQKIQLPAYGSRAVQVTQKVSRGETLVVTGFRDRSAHVDREGTFSADIPFPFGGTTTDAARTEQVLLITAEAGQPLGIVESRGEEL